MRARGPGLVPLSRSAPVFGCALVQRCRERRQRELFGALCGAARHRLAGDRIRYREGRPRGAQDDRHAVPALSEAVPDGSRAREQAGHVDDDLHEPSSDSRVRADSRQHARAGQPRPAIGDVEPLCTGVLSARRAGRAARPRARLPGDQLRIRPSGDDRVGQRRRQSRRRAARSVSGESDARAGRRHRQAVAQQQLRFPDHGAARGAARGWTFKAYTAAGKLLASCDQSGATLTCDKTGFVAP